MSKSIKINGKWPIILPDASADEWIGNMEHHHNSWEMPRLLVLEKEIKGYNKHPLEGYMESPVVYYVGAYKGDMSALLASWGATVCNFEATPAFWSLIKETWDLNDLTPPEFNFAGLVSNKTTIEPPFHPLRGWPKEIETPYFEGKVGFSHLAESAGVLPEITLDDFWRFTDLKPDIITMDIEGSELEAMKGAINIIKEVHPTLLLSVHPEFMFHNHGTYERELHDLLRDNGYEYWEWLDYDHEHHWLYKHKGAKK
jgi:FkbM family methyltransferase